MNFAATLRIALLALRINKMRSALTMLGIIIGVAAVIVMVAVGNGAQARVEAQIRSLGSNIIMVLSGSMTSGGARGGSGSQQTIYEEDAAALMREVTPSRLQPPRCAALGKRLSATPTGLPRSSAPHRNTSTCVTGRLPRGAALSQRK